MMQRNKMVIKVLVMTLVSSLFGCTATDILSGKKQQDIKQRAEQEMKEAEQYIPSADEDEIVIFRNTYYIPELSEQDSERPEWFFEEDEIGLKLMSLAAFNSRLQQQHQVSVRMLDGLTLKEAQDVYLFSLYHTGKIGDALKKVSLATGLSFSIEENVLTWSKFEHASFDLSFIPGMANFQFGDDEQSGQESNSGGGSNSIQVQQSASFVSGQGGFANFKQEEEDAAGKFVDVINMLKSTDGRFTLDGSTLYVKDTPEFVRRISEFVRVKNQKLTAQVLFDIKIIDYRYERGDQFSLNLNALQQDLSASGVVAIGTEFASNFLGGLAPIRLSYTRQGGKYNGSEAVINALKANGVSFTVQEPKILTRNGQIAQAFSGEDVTYLAQAGGISTANVGAQNTLTPGVVSPGLQLFATATINLDEGSLVAKISNRFSDLLPIESITSGGQTIQVPRERKKTFFQDFYVKDGETILLSGLTTRRSEYTGNTGGSLLFGGEKSASEEDTNTLILVTPRIIKGS